MKKNTEKKKYTKPTIKSETVLERVSLICGMDPGQCRDSGPSTS